MRNPSRPVVWVVLASLLLVACAQQPGSPVEQPLITRAAPLNPVQAVGELEHGALSEVSGLASSHIDADRLWAVNDSGNDPVLFALDRQGRHLGLVELDRVGAHDIESMVSTTIGGQPILLLGDIGDNNAQRDSVRLIWAVEPTTLSGRVAPSIARLRWPDGARDAESIAVDPTERRVYFISKRDVVPRLYRIDFDQLIDDADITAEFVGTIATIPPPDAAILVSRPDFGLYSSQPTDFEFTADGKRMVILNYRELVIFDRDDEDWGEAVQRQPTIVPLPFMQQSEALTIHTDGTIFVTSEQRPAPLYAVRLD